MEAEPHRVFTTTGWSLVLAGANSEGDQQNKAAEALGGALSNLLATRFFLQMHPGLFQ